MGVHGDVLYHRERGIGEGIDTNKSKADKKSDGKQTSVGGTTEHAHQGPVCIQHAGGQGTLLSDGRDTRDGRQDVPLDRHQVIGRYCKRCEEVMHERKVCNVCNERKHTRPMKSIKRSEQRRRNRRRNNKKRKNRNKPKKNNRWKGPTTCEREMRKLVEIWKTTEHLFQ